MPSNPSTCSSSKRALCCGSRTPQLPKKEEASTKASLTLMFRSGDIRYTQSRSFPKT
ncbi:hypothetical protein JOE49_000694 [Paenibacillus sp. PvR133]|nr:hypothetical protein [Paenibacillus sp. PvR133]